MVFSPPVIEMRVALGWSRHNARTRQGGEIPGHGTPFHKKSIGVLVMALPVCGSDHHFPGSYLFSWSGRPEDKNWFEIGANPKQGRPRPAWTTPYAFLRKGYPHEFYGVENELAGVCAHLSNRMEERSSVIFHQPHTTQFSNVSQSWKHARTQR